MTDQNPVTPATPAAPASHIVEIHPHPVRAAIYWIALALILGTLGCLVLGMLIENPLRHLASAQMTLAAGPAETDVVRPASTEMPAVATPMPDVGWVTISTKIVSTVLVSDYTATSQPPMATATAVPPNPTATSTTVPATATNPVPTALSPGDSFFLAYQDPWFVTDGRDSQHHWRISVAAPGETAKMLLYFNDSVDEIRLERMAVDDLFHSATLYLPDGRSLDITELFLVVPVPAGGTGDTIVDAYMEARGIDTKVGQLLPHNGRAVTLKNVPAGAYIVFEIQDDESKAVLVGLTLFTGGIKPPAELSVIVYCRDLYAELPAYVPTFAATP